MTPVLITSIVGVVVIVVVITLVLRLNRRDASIGSGIPAGQMSTARKVFIAVCVVVLVVIIALVIVHTFSR